MQKEFDILLSNRKSLLHLANQFTADALNTIPEGFSNNIIWNLAHLVVTQQILWYKLSGLEMSVPEAMVQKYQKGSRPGEYVHAEEIDHIKSLLVSLPQKSIEDFRRGVFKEYSNYMTSAKVELTCIEDAIKFNNYHEGLHLGTVLALRKVI